MSERFVVGVDGSSPSRAALEWALDRAERDPHPVVLVHVTDDDWGNMGASFREAAMRAGNELLAGLLERTRAEHPTVDLATALISGSTAWALGSFARPDDLLVIGTHKTGFLNGRVLGSRSVQVAAVAVCDVMIVPEVDLRFREGVVAGIDRVETASVVATAAAREAARLDEELVLLHATAGAASDGAARPPLSTAAEAVRAHTPLLPLRSRVSNRPAAEALLDVSRDKSLLVLGPGSRRADRSPIGSVVHDVLMNIATPVMIVHRGSVAADHQAVVDVADVG